MCFRVKNETEKHYVILSRGIVIRRMQTLRLAFFSVSIEIDRPNRNFRHLAIVICFYRITMFSR